MWRRGYFSLQRGNTMNKFCRRGHNIDLVGRYPHTGKCRECERSRVRAWKQANRDKVLADGAARREAYRQIFGVSYMPNRR